MLGGVSGRVDDEALDDESDAEENGHGDQHREVGVDPITGEEHEGKIHADRHQASVSEVDDAENTEDQSQPHRHQAVDATDQEAGDGRLTENDPVAREPEHGLLPP